MVTPMNQDIYGFLSQDIEAVAHKLADILTLTWQARNSSFWDDYYLFPPFQSRYQGESLKLCTNYAHEDMRWNMPKHRKYGVVLYVSRSIRTDEIETLLKEAFGNEVALLKRVTDSA